jgi:hypothetical protein
MSSSAATANKVYSKHHHSQRAKFAEKVQKPPLQVNVIIFELNGLDASIINMGPLESLRPQKVMIL